jgi:hypothetical protein
MCWWFSLSLSKDTSIRTRRSGKAESIVMVKKTAAKYKPQPKRTIKDPPKGLKTTIPVERIEAAVRDVMSKRTEKKPRFVQLLNPSVLLSTLTYLSVGRIVAHKKSPGPYVGIEPVKGKP